MNRAVMTIALVLFTMPSFAAEEVTFRSLLNEMADRDGLVNYPKLEYRSLQASSYNRASVARDQLGWFADSDGTGFIRTMEMNGRMEYVMMEHKGPGCITKIWTPFFYYDFGERVGPNIKIYLDDAEEPVINESLINLVMAKSFVKEPLAGYTARAGDLYLPIPFAKSCKVTMEKKPFYNIINYRAYPDGTKVETFSMKLFNECLGDIGKTGRLLLLEEPEEPAAESVVAGDMEAGKGLSVDLPDGANAVRRLEIKLDGNWIKDSPAALRSTILVMDFDGVQAVWCPVGDFFCSANALNPIKTWTRCVTADGIMTCSWVMPYKAKAKVSLLNLGKQNVRVNLTVGVTKRDWTDRSMYFHCNWRCDDIVPGTPFLDWNFIDIKGKGVFVGDAWTVLNPDRGWWGEGDEKIYVDEAYDNKFPTHFGTGTEDYYGWAGGVNPVKADVFSVPYLANASVGSTAENNSRGFNVCTRIRALDAIPFTNRIVFDMEASPGTQTRNKWNLLCYSAAVFWYAMPGAECNRPPLPAAAALPITTLEKLDEMSMELRPAPGSDRNK